MPILGLRVLWTNGKAVKPFLRSVILIPLAAVLPLAGQSMNSTSGSWSGVVINSTCNADAAFAEQPECIQKGVPGSKLSLYDDNIRQVYLLDPQEQATGHEGDSVTIRGTLDGTTLHVASLELLASVGLAVGQKAPSFSARDQFGREQTLATLQGPKGTVLLFFRSADW